MIVDHASTNGCGATSTATHFRFHTCGQAPLYLWLMSQHRGASTRKRGELQSSNPLPVPFLRQHPLHLAPTRGASTRKRRKRGELQSSNPLPVLFLRQHPLHLAPTRRFDAKGGGGCGEERRPAGVLCRTATHFRFHSCGNLMPHPFERRCMQPARGRAANVQPKSGSTAACLSPSP